MTYQPSRRDVIKAALGFAGTVGGIELLSGCASTDVTNSNNVSQPTNKPVKKYNSILEALNESSIIDIVKAPTEWNQHLNMQSDKVYISVHEPGIKGPCPIFEMGNTISCINYRTGQNKLTEGQFLDYIYQQEILKAKWDGALAE